MDHQACVVIYGKHPVLLETRRLVIERAGYRAAKISAMVDVSSSVMGQVRVLVLCHTLAQEQQEEAIAIARQANPSLTAIVMTNYARIAVFPEYSHTIYAFEGPEDLIALLHDTMGERNDLLYAS
jgi:hypothetical protein